MVISDRTMRFRAALLTVVFLAPALALSQSAQTQKLPNAPEVFVRRVVQDEAGILASPVRTSAKDLLWLVPFGVATGFAIDYDAHAMRSLGFDPERQDRFETVSNVGAIYLPIAATGTGFLVGHVTHNDLMTETAVLSTEAMVDATLLNQGLKYAIDRQDPMQGDFTGRFWPHGTKTWPDGQSMPSGHAMNVWAFAHVVAMQYNGPATKAIVYSMAATVSVSRVLARQHFPSDVLVGSVFGYLVGGYVVHRRSREFSYLSLSSVTTPNGRGVELSYNFVH